MRHKNSTNKIAMYSELLEPVLAKRIGGAVNITGIYYQVLYACLAILRELQNSNATIRLEGIEDIDINNSIITNGFEYTQLKSSKNKLDAYGFWDLGVLQNYLEVYHKEPCSRFRLVYNMKTTDGNLKNLFEGNLDEKSKKYWFDKLNSLPYKGLNYSQFIETISFEFASINDITSQILKLLYKEWNVNIGTEGQFLRSLFYNALIWSRDRKEINKNDVAVLFQDITDSFSKAPINEAIKNDWIRTILFSKEEKDYSNYYEGKAALPIHIAQGLPVRRILWERKIESLLNESDSVIIKSSSGQGKSTLAWQTGYNKKDLYDIYQVQYCPDVESANSILQFIQTRLNIGQSPLIIFDGLNSSLKSWNYVAENAANLPVKFIITTRNEDWYRYGSDVSKSNIQFIDINLSKEEARSIYDELQKKGKLNISDSWQSVWEKVQEKGLLIEYTYLLTKGEMIQERLKYQVSTLNKTQSAAAKLEILRLVSLADSMNIKIRTHALLKHIAENIGFSQDRGEILKELADEYFLNFENIYIGGLHPVRSNHLVAILHENLPIKDSLISLFILLDEIYFSDYFINAPLHLDANNKKSFYDELGAILSQRNFNQMVLALDGVFHLEPQMYWSNNRQIYDDSYETGSVELFTMTSIPFTDYAVPQLDELANTLGEMGKGFSKLSELAKQLPRFTINETDVYQLASSIQKHLKKRDEKIETYIGFGSLAQWFKALNLSLIFNVDVFSKIDVEYFFVNINSIELNEAKEIATFCLINKKEEYLKYSKKYRKDLISYLKRTTDSLTIEEKGNELHINYLLYGDDVTNANEMSVQRIQVVYTFLPVYERYCTEAIILPFPNEEVVSFTRESSKKQMPPGNIVNEFDVHLNQIWYKTILKNYESVSVYEWQKSIIEFRENALELVFNLCQYIDSLLEANNKKQQSSLQKIIKLSEHFRKLDIALKPYPTFNQKYNEDNSRRIKETNINNWRSSLRNVSNQMLNIFTPKEEHDRSVVLYNLKATFLSTGDMQECFNLIVRGSFEYFDASLLESRELELYERLCTIVQYYISQIPLNDKPAIKGAKNVAKEWWKTQIKNKLQQLKMIFENASTNEDYIFYFPSKFEETDTLTYVTIGIEGLDFSNGDSLQKLSIDLVGLADFSADFYTILNIENGVVLSGLRFRQDFFKALRDELNDLPSENILDLMPLPVFPDEKMIQTLSGVSLPPQSSGNTIQDKKFQMLIELWKLKEYRNHLNIKSPIENEWLTKVEEKITSDIKKLQVNFDDSEFVKWIDSIILNSTKLSTSFIVEKIYSVIQKVS
ncbi:hypothetical protein [Bacteroides sedimenti]|uniref:ATP-binding protein n=1 Tax=Bacteroides sedimenti TaxID=2136147 RepID=A0ABM8IHP5_9BACE